MGWKEKPHKAAQKQKTKERADDTSHFEAEMLRMQGLVICDGCKGTYGVYEPRCPHCDAPNRTHYSAKV